MNDNLAYQEDFDREELINGELVAMSPATTNHTLVSSNIYAIFWHYLRGKKCVPIGDGTKVFLTEKDHFVPDMMVVCDRNKIRSKGVYGAPDLVVEVLSPSTAKRDKTHKKEIYARCGVREYWLVSPGDRSVEVYCSSGTELTLDNIYTFPYAWDLEEMTDEKRAALETHFKCSLYDDLDISLEDIFYNTL
jgi:Uma2 family endonuclease